MQILTSPLIGTKFDVLDDGYVQLVDVMGSDQRVEKAARVSYGEGTRSVSKTRSLLRYLMRHRHTTPFEMCEVCFKIRVPMDCWRQWIRHRTANVNEYSTRYSEAIDSMAATDPDAWRLQDQSNKQGSSNALAANKLIKPVRLSDGTMLEAMEDVVENLSTDEREFHERARALYIDRLASGVAREQARKDLPLSTYTEAYWKMDLHNIFHFLSLRMDSHAQLEIRSYANIIGHEFIAKLFPICWEAFVDYRLEGMFLTALELKVLKGSISVTDIENKREREECITKLDKLKRLL